MYPSNQYNNSCILVIFTISIASICTVSTKEPPTIHDIIVSHAPDVILLQEHWLTPVNLSQLDSFQCYFLFGSSAMNHVVAAGVLRGRFYGGFAVLIKEHLRPIAKMVISEERFCVLVYVVKFMKFQVRLAINTQRLLSLKVPVTNCYTVRPNGLLENSVFLFNVDCNTECSIFLLPFLLFLERACINVDERSILQIPLDVVRWDGWSSRPTKTCHDFGLD